MFTLDPAFEATSAPLTEMWLCSVRLQLDARWPWLVMIPRGEALVELENLYREDRLALTDELIRAGQAVRAIGEAIGRPVEKLNIGQLGNITRQLHFHVIGRRADDAAWPGPVWGHGAAEAIDAKTLRTMQDAARRVLG